MDDMDSIGGASADQVVAGGKLLEQAGVAMEAAAAAIDHFGEAVRRAQGEQPFPFTKPEGSEVEMFIQWKGTTVCLDFRCPCGFDGHVDGAYAYYVECGGCGAVYEMGTQVIARRVEEADGATVVTVA